MTKSVEQSIQEKIRQRRAQMLVHSYLYYEMDQTLITDHQWQEFANELVKLQAECPEAIGFYDKEFEGWDGTTGFHLPRDNWVRGKAAELTRYIK